MVLLVAVGLLAGAVVYLLAMMRSEAKASSDLKAKQDELQRLVNFDPALNDANIGKIQDEIKWFKDYTPQLGRLLLPDTNVVVNMDDQSFKSKLDNTVSELAGEADSAGVSLKAKYSFTFEHQRTMVRVPTNSIPVLAAQLHEVKELCRILFRSKVHSLEGLRRVRAYAEEPAGSQDYIDGSSIVTNNTAGGSVVITPYEVRFRGFSAELSSVLQELATSRVFFNVKRLSIQALEVQPSVATLPAPAKASPQPKSPKNAKVSTPASVEMQTIMDEKPLQIFMSLEVVKLLPPAAPSAVTPATTP